MQPILRIDVFPTSPLPLEVILRSFLYLIQFLLFACAGVGNYEPAAAFLASFFAADVRADLSFGW